MLIGLCSFITTFRRVGRGLKGQPMSHSRTSRRLTTTRHCRTIRRPPPSQPQPASSAAPSMGNCDSSKAQSRQASQPRCPPSACSGTGPSVRAWRVTTGEAAATERAAARGPRRCEEQAQPTARCLEPLPQPSGHARKPPPARQGWFRPSAGQDWALHPPSCSRNDQDVAARAARAAGSRQLLRSRAFLDAWSW